MQNNISFKAKFTNTQSMRDIAEYAMQNPNRWEKLNTARKEIEKFDPFTKLELTCGTNYNGGSFVEITRYKPVDYMFKNCSLEHKYDVKQTIKEYPEKNPVKAAYNLILKMSHSAPENNTYKKIVK